MLVTVKRFSGASGPSPIMRFGHRFTTSISSWFSPAWTAEVISTRYGRVHTMPTFFLFNRTSATSFTSPRSRNTRWLRCALNSNLLEYVAVPE